jgi:hypothetical protein
MGLVALKKALCHHLFNYLRRSLSYIPVPDIEDILHYASCPKFVGTIEAQDWKVGYREESGIIREVLFVRSCLDGRCPSE